MSGTRKMDKFDIDAFTKAAEQDGDADAPLDDEGGDTAIEPLPPVSADLPARPFEPRLPSPPLVQPVHETSGPKPARTPLGPPPRKNVRTNTAKNEAWHEARFAAPSSGTPDMPDASTGVTNPEVPFSPPIPPDQADTELLPLPAVVEAALADMGDDDAPTTPGVTPTVTQRIGPPTPGPQEWVPGEWVPPQQAQEGEAKATDPDALRTRQARKFVSLADSVTESFKSYSVGAGAWRVELTAPGMSTGGGKQALQHLRLLPKQPGYSVLVAGAINQVEKRAELRDFDHVAIVHEVRFRHALEVSRQEWEDFLKKAEGVLNAAGIQSMRTPPPRELLEQRRSMQRVSKGAVVALVVVLFLAAIVVWRVIVTITATKIPLE